MAAWVRVSPGARARSVSSVSGRACGAGLRQEMPADREAVWGLGSAGSSPEPPSQGPRGQPSVLVCGVLEAERPPSIPPHHAHFIVCVPPSPPCHVCPSGGGAGAGWRALTHGGGPLPRPWELAGLGAVPLMPLPQRRQRSQGEAEAEAGQLVRGSEQGPGELPGGQGHGLSALLARQSPALGGPLPPASVPRARRRPRNKPGGPTLFAGPHPRASSGSEPPPWRLLGASSGPSPSALPSFREPWTWGAQAGTPAPPPGPLPGPSLSYWTRSSRELIPKATGCGEGAEAGVPLGHQAETWYPLQQGPTAAQGGALRGPGCLPHPQPTRPGPAEGGESRERGASLSLGLRGTL